MESNPNQYFHSNATAQNPALLPVKTLYQYRLEIMDDGRRHMNLFNISTDGQLDHLERVEKYLHGELLTQLKRTESIVEEILAARLENPSKFDLLVDKWRAAIEDTKKSANVHCAFSLGSSHKLRKLKNDYLGRHRAGHQNLIDTLDLESSTVAYPHACRQFFGSPSVDCYNAPQNPPVDYAVGGGHTHAQQQTEERDNTNPDHFLNCGLSDSDTAPQ